MMVKRDLKADLELCNKATLGPWEVFPPLCGPEGQTVYQVDSGGPICDVSDPYPRGDNKPQENMMFIAQAREGWPHAIERALEAEALTRELVDLISELVWAIEKAEVWDGHPDTWEPIEEIATKAKGVLGDE